jgi:hypothetical protein
VTANVSRLPDPEPQDRKPKKKASVGAREAEADDGYVTVEQCGIRLRIPLAGKTPIAAYIAFKNGDELGGTELLLGADQWAAFMAKNPTMDDFAEVGKKLAEAAGN